MCYNSFTRSKPERLFWYHVHDLNVIKQITTSKSDINQTSIPEIANKKETDSLIAPEAILVT